MEPNEVLKQYIDMCNSRSGLFQYYLANNAILEWFGRTIRGRHKIYPYFRYDLCQQYQHSFYDAQSCEPIESRTPHFETKVIVEDDISHEAITSKKLITNITPIQFTNVSPKLPKINRGLKFIDDTDEEELTDLGLSTLRDTVTPPPVQLNIEEPPIKKTKHSTFIDYKLPNIEDSLDIPKTDVVDNKNINNPKLIPANNESIQIKYSPLMYLEVKGTLRMLNRSKHRGVQHTPTTSNNLNCTATNYTDLNSSNELLTTNLSSYWDRDTKLKISYRIRLLDKQIQFALIIYEHITRKPTTKRNLLSEFEETTNNNKNELNFNSKKETLSKISKEHNISSELKRKKPLKRLLRLF